MRTQATRKLPEEITGDEVLDSEASETSEFSLPAQTTGLPDMNEKHPPTPSVSDLTQSKPAAAVKLGERLSQAREAMGFTQEDVASRLYLEPRIITALEKERYNQLPPVIFVQGYLRSYAKLLNLPPEEVLNQYYRSTDQAPPKLSSEATVQQQRRMGQHHEDSPHRTRYWWNGMTLLLVLVLIGLVAWRYSGHLSLPDLLEGSQQQNDDPASASNVMELPPQPPLTLPANDAGAEASNPNAEYTPPTESSTATSEDPKTTIESIALPPIATGTPPDAATTAQPATNNTATGSDEPEPSETMPDAETAAPAATGTATADAAPAPLLELDFTGASWVSITDKKGKRLLYTTAKAGDKHKIESGEPPFKVTLGRSQSVSNFKFRGEAVDLSKYQGKKARFTLGQ